MTRRPPLRRFTDTIVRLRPRSVGYNEFGEWTEDSFARAALPASVQPLLAQDREEEGGAIFSARLVVFVPVGLRRAVGATDVLTWGGSVLLWGGDPLSWSGQSGVESDNELPLQTSPTDKIDFAGNQYVVVSARTWPESHCRAELLAES